MGFLLVYTETMPIFEPLFDALNTAKVRYVVVGGLAVVLHGHARLTADLDLIVDLEPDEAHRAISALVAAGLIPQVPVRPEQFADPEIRQSWIRDKGMHVFSMLHPDNPMLIVDLFVENPIPFEDLWMRSTEAELGSIQIRIAAIEDLILLKEQAGRSKDLDDIEKLRQIQQLQKEKG
jgi:hypothetical protein